jgi:hypothetical protein
MFLRGKIDTTGERVAKKIQNGQTNKSLWICIKILNFFIFTICVAGQKFLCSLP